LATFQQPSATISDFIVLSMLEKKKPKEWTVLDPTAIEHSFPTEDRPSDVMEMCQSV
jgi:hypothetical protein